jgi:hypothetical protein
MKELRLLACLMLAVGMVNCTSDSGIRDRTTVDAWSQAPNNEIDILWVVDDSCSMSEEQAALTQGFVSFVDEMEASGTNFHIGLITTSLDYSDPNRGQLVGDPPYLTVDDDYVGAFQERVIVGTQGSDKEKGLEAVSYALSPLMTLPGSPNEGFLRDEASLLVVFVSDEEDCSDEGALEGRLAEDCYLERQLLTNVQQIIRDYWDIKDGDRDRVQVGAIVGLDNGACEDAYPGRRYMDAAALTGGLVGDICSGDWSTILADLGLTAVGIKTKFRTSYLAKVDTLTVEVDEEEIPQDETNGWTYDESTWYISFHGDAIPERGQQIVARYTIQPGATPPIE